MKYILVLLFFAGTYLCSGQQLVYSPKNPAFGGDPFHYTWLLNSANSQNSFKDPNAAFEQQSELDAFTENLNRQLLSQLSRKLLDDQLGEGPLEPGTFSFGSLEVEVFDSSEGLVINILDINTGETSQVIVPN
jgi:curli production assembly/transport component CsgF|tara:strand:- start:62884 stop:63282 length:399 start_codon:yes stop_codon:yes gene_type:complete